MSRLPKGVAATSGGKFDPASANMAFLAGTVEDHQIAQNANTLIAVNELRPRHLPILDEWCDNRNVLLDSGVFALTMDYARKQGIHFFEALTMAPEEVEGFDELYDKYCGLVTTYKDRLWGAIELDQGGAANKPRVRAKVVADTGITPIPVYHPLGDGWAYYDQIVSTHDRICFANLSKATTPVRLRLMTTAAMRARDYPYLWTHLLGVTPSANMLGQSFRGSCDSSAWLSAVRWSSSWRAWAMLDKLSNFPPAMTYERGSDKDEDGGYRKAKQLVAAEATFQQRTFTAVAADTHPTQQGPIHP
jgi:hypothetical protein